MTGRIVTARQLPARDYLGLKAATRAATKKFGSDAHAARATRVTPVQIHRYGNAEDGELAETFMPIDIVADLEAEIGPVITAELARLSNHVLCPLPPGAASAADLGRITGAAMKETGDVFASMGRALEDGVFTSVEGQHLIREIDEAFVRLAQMRLRCEQAIADGDRARLAGRERD